MSRDEFSRAVEAFLGELGVLCIHETEDTLRRLPQFFEHFREVSAALRNPTASNDEVLGTACGLIDEYVGANWDRVIEDSYRFYCDQQVVDVRDAEKNAS